jgi:hypothetical protein
MPKKGNEMKSMKIKYLRISIIDNIPGMLDNHWFDPGLQTAKTGQALKQEYESRYKLNVRVLTPMTSIDLTCNLLWPPSKLARRQRWQQHKEIYDSWRDQAQLLKDSVDRNSPIPPLLGMPSEYQTFKSNKKGLLHRWRCPSAPSMFRVELMRASAEEKYWRVTWHTDQQNFQFVLDKETTNVWREPNRTGGESLFYAKNYNHGFNINPDCYVPTEADPDPNLKNFDWEYEEFKQRIDSIFKSNSPTAQDEIKHVCDKFPEYAERMNNEFIK